MLRRRHKNFKTFLSESIRLMHLIFDTYLHLVDLYRDRSSYYPGAKTVPPTPPPLPSSGADMLYIDLYRENLQKSSETRRPGPLIFGT